MLRRFLCWLGWHPRPEIQVELELWRVHEDGTRFRVREFPGLTINMQRECNSCGRQISEG